MTVSAPLILIIAALVFACYRWMGLRAWHLAACILLGFLLAASSLGPQIQVVLDYWLHGGRK
jgi:hypothetical protein